MTKKPRRPVKKRPYEATTNHPLGGPRPVAGHPGGIDIVAAVASRQSVAAGARGRTDEPADASRSPHPLPKTAPRPARRMEAEQAPAPAVAPARPADSVPAPAAENDHRGFFDSLDPQGLAGTYWIDTDTWEGPENVSVRFSGIRAASEPGAPPEQFETYEDVESIMPGTGRIAVTSRVTGISAGTWNLTSSPVPRAERAASPAAHTALPGAAPTSSTVQTRFAGLAQGPGVNLASWPLLVGAGAILAVALQAIFLTMQGIDPAGAVWLTVLANTVGGVGARLWWLALKRQPLSNFLQAGACIQGFLAGALATIIIGSLIFGLPVGRILDATAAGLFFGMALGRPGCFFTGCCVGRPTASRWGLWSSDRRLGRRRHPVQLYEALLALLIGLGSLPFMLAGPPNIPGLVFIGTVTAYTLGRQLLFPLREDPRTLWGRALTIAVCTLVLGAVILLAATS